MLTAVASVTDAVVEVHFVATEEGGEGAEQAVPEKDLNPIAPEAKEIVWGFGSFVVLALLMRYLLYPRLRKGMDARYALIKGGHDEAEQVTASAKADVAQYDSQVATIRAEAQQRVDAAQADVENAVRAVAGRAGELATGRRPDPEVVNRAVADAMSAGVAR